MKTTTDKTVLITGASSGFGKAAADVLTREGYRVFGTSRHPSGAEAGHEMLELDVRSDASVKACVEAVMERAGRVDILINNAGYELEGAGEETSIDEAKAQFETNFFGVVRMTNAVLPVMRAQRGGKIINIGSLAGLVGVPFHGLYSATKYALEGYSETLRLEVAAFNIHVSLVEPGFSRTGLLASGVRSRAALADYAPMRGRVHEAFRRSLEAGMPPEAVAGTIRAIAKSDRPRLRYRVGSDSVWLPRLKTVVTEAGFAAGVRRKFHLDREEDR